MKKVFIVIGAGVLSIAASGSHAGFFSPSAEKLTPCDYASVQGDEFVFAPRLSQGGEKLDYIAWTYHVDGRYTEPLSYDAYAGKHGKITTEIIGGPGAITTYEKAVIENCDIAYVTMYKTRPSSSQIYFVKDINKAKTMIGKSVWINDPNPGFIKYIITAAPKVSYSVQRDEKVEVVDISTGEYSNASGSGSGEIFLKVRTATGREGFLRWSEDAYFESDPMPNPSESSVDVATATAKAQALIGKYVWVNDLNVVRPNELITTDEKISFPLHHMEKLLVTGISQEEYDHAYGSGPLFLKLKKASGEEGMLKFNDLYLYYSDPMPKGMAPKIKELIEHQKIANGMTKAQVLLSWGKPDSINRSVGPWGVHEQWVYGDSHYLYFTGDKLTSFQGH